METDEPVTVYTLNDTYEAEVVRTAIRSQGIPCELDGERQADLADMLEISLGAGATPTAIGGLFADTKFKPP